MINFSNDTFGVFMHSRQQLYNVKVYQPFSTCPGHKYNPLAIDYEDLNVDIFRNNDFMFEKEEKAKATQHYSEFSAKINIENKKFNSLWNNSDSYVVNPNASNCLWLTIDKLSRSGIGHTYRRWDYYLQKAIQVKLTYYAPFYTPFHGLCNLNETANYFGFHKLFY